jgi:hypothetical protein
LRWINSLLSDSRKRPQTTVRAHAIRVPVREAFGVLTVLNLVQLLLYIPLLALLGQGVLYALAGTRRDGNLFYQLLQLISRPFTFVVRKITPQQVADRHVPVVTFFLLLVVYAVVTFEKVDLCVRIGVEQCR